MDPSDIADFEVDLSGIDGLLVGAENVYTFSLALSAEAVALGLEIGTGPRAPITINSSTGIYLWLQVNASFISDPAFSGEGVELAIELTIDTNSSPSRRRQRTLVIRVAQR